MIGKSATGKAARLWTGPFVRICLVNLFVFVNFHALLPTFPFFVRHLGGDAVAIGVATAATRFALGRAIDRHGEARLVYAGNAAIVGSIVLLVCAHNVPCYLLSAVLLGFSFGAIQPSLQTMAMHAVPPHRRGAANSTFFVAFDSGLALGGFAAGVLIERIGFDAMFLCMIVPCALSTAYYYIYGRRHPSSFNPSSRTAAQPAAAPTPATADAPLVVTISREYGSGGHRIGQMLAHRLGIAFYDRELIDLTAQQSGLDHEQVTGSEQTVDARLACDNPVQTDVYLAQSRIIARLAAQGPCVIVGRLANLVLRGRPNRFDVFVYADANVRARRIAATCGVDADRAAQMVQRSDQERADHCLHYTGRHWGDRHSYHLMIDTSAVSESEAVAMIAAAVGQRRRHGANNAPNAAHDGCR